LTRKILHLIPRLSYSGGIENYIRILCSNSVEKNLEILICTFFTSNNQIIVDELDNQGIKIFVLKEGLFEKIDNRYLKFIVKNSIIAHFSKFNHFKKLVANVNPEVVFVHGEDSELVAAFLPKSVKKINIIHGEAYFPVNPFYRFILNKFARRKYKFTILVNEKLSKIPQKFKIPYKIIQPGIKLELYKPDKSKKRNDKGFLAIGFLGRITKEKGVFELLNAFYLLNKNHENIKLKFAGNGKAEKLLRKKVRELGLGHNVSFYGEVTNPSWFYKQIDIFILPSYTEGLPITILEAMASGVLIIASNVGGISEVIENNVNGILLEKVEPEQIAKIVDNIIKTPDLLKKISKNALNVSSRYNVSTTVHSFFQVINSQFISSN